MCATARNQRGADWLNRRALLAAQSLQPLNRKQCFFGGTLNRALQAVVHAPMSPRLGGQQRDNLNRREHLMRWMIWLTAQRMPHALGTPHVLPPRLLECRF